jgi:iron complex transport system substrate-binding protein
MVAGQKRLIGIVLAAAVVVGGVRPATTQARAAEPRRIVSLVPALTEMLFALGAGPRVVAVSSYDEFPPEVKSLPRVGALLDPDMERILALRPDLVVIYGSQTDLQSQFARAGIRAFNYRHAGLAGVFNTLKELGAAVGRSGEADRLAREIRERLDAIQARVRGRPRPRTLLVFERDPASLRGVYVSGGVGFLHDMLEIAGGVNVFADMARESVQPSVETMLARAPDVILEVRVKGLLAPADVAEAKRVWAALASVPAVQHGRIQILHGDHLVVPGPRVVQGTEAFARALHPDAFK